jgi:hypothetical protein
MATKSIDIADIVRLRQTWKKQNWNDNQNEEHVFTQFCNIIPQLSDEQKELIHELTENYLWLSSKEYEERFNAIVDNIAKLILKDCKTIYLFPIIKPGDDNKIKSGKHCIYYLKGSIFSFNPAYQNINLEIIEDYTAFQRCNFKDDGTEILLLVDDFIGSGETFNDAWKEIQKNVSVNEKFVSIFTLIIQNEAYEELAKFGLQIHYSEIRYKGITDSYHSPEKEEKIRIMEEIEDMIKPSFFSFGYKRSEALITLIRTPDNTFPFFWMKYKLKGTDFSGPFFRP